MQETLNLTKNEAKVYSALLNGTELEVSEITSSTSLPRSRVYEVLASLASKGLLERRSSSASSYRLIPPNESVIGLIDSYKQEHQSRVAAMQEFREFLHKKWKSNFADVSPGVEYMSFEEAEPMFIDHLRNINSRVWIAAADTNASIDMRESGKVLASNYREGFDIRYLMPNKQLAERVKRGFESFPPFSKLDLQLKYHDELYSSYVIVDEIIYIFFFGNDEALQASTLRTTSSSLLNSFEWMFKQLWEEAEDLM